MEAWAEGAVLAFSKVDRQMRELLQGLDADALNWKPGPETNSLWVLATHMVAAQRWYLAKAVGDEFTRDRAAEFASSGADTARLIADLDTAEAETRAAFERLTAADMSREVEIRGPWTVGRILFDLAEHLSEHMGHAQLTRQLWDART
ncbi:MAG: DUF664 domain-containing protein [Chloroflexi bacterium]|nr:DUF664 domain-containing protein [Chloroflexota bacterium]